MLQGFRSLFFLVYIYFFYDFKYTCMLCLHESNFGIRCQEKKVFINLSSVQYVRSPALRVAEVCWGQSQVSEGVYLFQLKNIYINII